MSSKQQKLEAALHVFRHGFATQFSADNLESLAEVIRCSPCRIIQRAPVECVGNAHNLRTQPVRTSVIGFLVAQNVETVGELWDGFSRACHECSLRLGEPALSAFMDWYDRTPKKLVLSLIACEIQSMLR